MISKYQRWIFTRRNLRRSSKNFATTHAQEEPESSGHRQALDEKMKPIQLFIERLTILIDDLINDSISYCACVIVSISDGFSDDRHENRLVEIHLKICMLYLLTFYAVATAG